jgi:hypothetical protein
VGVEVVAHPRPQLVTPIRVQAAELLEPPAHSRRSHNSQTCGGSPESMLLAGGSAEPLNSAGCGPAPRGQPLNSLAARATPPSLPRIASALGVASLGSATEAAKRPSATTARWPVMGQKNLSLDLRSLVRQRSRRLPGPQAGPSPPSIQFWATATVALGLGGPRPQHRPSPRGHRHPGGQVGAAHPAPKPLAQTGRSTSASIIMKGRRGRGWQCGDRRRRAPQPASVFQGRITGQAAHRLGAFSSGSPSM